MPRNLRRKREREFRANSRAAHRRAPAAAQPFCGQAEDRLQRPVEHPQRASVISILWRLGSKELKQYCELSEATKELLKFVMTDLNLGARAYDRILGSPLFSVE